MPKLDPELWVLVHGFQDVATWSYTAQLSAFLAAAKTFARQMDIGGTPALQAVDGAIFQIIHAYLDSRQDLVDQELKDLQEYLRVRAGRPGDETKVLGNAIAHLVPGLEKEDGVNWLEYLVRWVSGRDDLRKGQAERFQEHFIDYGTQLGIFDG